MLVFKSIFSTQGFISAILLIWGDREHCHLIVLNICNGFMIWKLLTKQKPEETFTIMTIPPQSRPVVLSLVLLFLATAIAKGNKEENRSHLCNLTEWELVEQNYTVEKNISGVLQKGTGEKKDVLTHVTIEKDGKYFVNTTYTVEDCCIGFSRRGKKDKCKPCRHGTYGQNCSESCECDGCKKCNRKTGECRKCRDPTEPLTNSTTTLIPTSTSSTPTTNQAGTAVDLCSVCRQYYNCTSKDCKLTAPRTGSKDGDGDSSTILIAVILSLGTLTVILLIGFVLRERRHRLKKQRQHSTDPVKFSALEKGHEYVDPEPVYQEILDEDITSIQNGDVKKKLQKQNSGEYQTPNENVYQPSSEMAYKPPSETAHKPPSVFEYEKAKPINVDESGYLSPYTPLRFARSETNLVRDKKIKEKGDYGSPYCLAKEIEKDDDCKTSQENINQGDAIGGPKSAEDSVNKGEETHNDSTSSQDNIVRDEEEKLIDPSERSSHNKERVSDTPVYFVLEKAKTISESQDSEKDTLLRKETQI